MGAIAQTSGTTQEGDDVTERQGMETEVLTSKKEDAGGHRRAGMETEVLEWELQCFRRRTTQEGNGVVEGHGMGLKC
jgi:hypothetical protein